MTLPTKSTGHVVTATEWNAVIAAINAVNGRQIFTSSGSFTWPVGVNTVKVKVAGGGGHSGGTWFGGPGGTTSMPPLDGSPSPLCSIFVSGVDAGTTIAVAIGGPGASRTSLGVHPVGGTSSFGAYVSSTGGEGAYQGTAGARGTHTGDIAHSNDEFLFNLTGDTWVGYGESNAPGIVVIEW